MVSQDFAKTGGDLKFKIAFMPIYGKNHSDDFFSRTTGWLGWYFAWSIWDTSLYEIPKTAPDG